MRQIAGKVALVTGGVSGVGLGIAQSMLSAGLRVVITYLSPLHVETAARQLHDYKESVRFVQMDVSDRGAMAETVPKVLHEFGRIHLLVNNAGVNMMGPVDLATYEDWDWILGVNLNGVVNALVNFLPHIKTHNEGGHIVNVGSMSAFLAGPDAGIYTTSKFALRGLSECLRYSLAPHRIGVSFVCPGVMKTDMATSFRNRPQTLERSRLNQSEAMVKELRRIHDCYGMAPSTLGDLVVEGIKRNQFYIFSHAEFREELELSCAELLEAQPTGSVDGGRLQLIETRRAQIAAYRDLITRL